MRTITLKVRWTYLTTTFESNAQALNGERKETAKGDAPWLFFCQEKNFAVFRGFSSKPEVYIIDKGNAMGVVPTPIALVSTKFDKIRH